MNALDVSKIVIAYFDTCGDLITNKKLQKLLYYIEAWSLVHQSSIIDEDFEAWIHGPVIPEVYHKFKIFNYSPIKNEYKEGESASKKLNELLKDHIDRKDLIIEVLNKYGQMTSYHLENLTHSEEPWIKARIGLGELDHSSIKIDKKIMKSYYKSLINNEK